MIFGYLGDLILIPPGVWLALRIIPPEMMAESRARAQMELDAGLPANKAAAVVIVVIWLVTAVLLARWGLRCFRR